MCDSFQWNGMTQNHPLELQGHVRGAMKGSCIYLHVVVGSHSCLLLFTYVKEGVSTI